MVSGKAPRKKAWALIEQGNALAFEADDLPEDRYRQALALDLTKGELFNTWGNLLCAKAKVLGDDAEA